MTFPRRLFKIACMTDLISRTVRYPRRRDRYRRQYRRRTHCTLAPLPLEADEETQKSTDTSSSEQDTVGNTVSGVGQGVGKTVGGATEGVSYLLSSFLPSYLLAKSPLPLPEISLSPMYIHIRDILY
jgi:hypothetical protein